MDHQHENSSNKKSPEAGAQDTSGKNRTSVWASVYIKMWCIRWRDAVIATLERIDRRLNNRQRKWLFYLGLLICSSFLLCLVGAALQKPSAVLVPPLLIHKKQAFKGPALKRMQGDSVTIIIQPTK